MSSNSAKTDRRMKRWQEQRWIVDAVIQTIGPEWDQARVAYMSEPGGGEAVADFRMAAARMKKFDDIEREYVAAARRREAKAKAFEDESRLVSARESYLVASLLWASARWPIFEINDRLRMMDERMNHCYAKFIAYADRPIERAEIPFGDRTLPAYLHLPRQPEAGERFPCVLVIGGMDNSKENGVMMYGDKLLERDVAVLALDGPGQGECCTRAIHVTESNHEDAAVAAVDWLCAHPSIDPDRIALKGSSFGTYFGTRAAAVLKDRIKGACVALICQEPGNNTIFNMGSPTFKIRYMFMAGYEDEAEFDKFSAKFDLRPIVGNLTAPYMVVAGEDDELCPLEFTEDLFNNYIKVPKRLCIFEGAGHGIAGVPSTALGENRATLMADWLKDRLDGKPAVSERAFYDATGRAHVTPYN